MYINALNRCNIYNNGPDPEWYVGKPVLSAGLCILVAGQTVIQYMKSSYLAFTTLVLSRLIGLITSPCLNDQEKAVSLSASTPLPMPPSGELTPTPPYSVSINHS